MLPPWKTRSFFHSQVFINLSVGSQTYHNDVTVIGKLGRQPNMPFCTLRHSEDNISQLRRLANRPIEKNQSSVRIHSRRINNDILDPDVKVDRATKVRVLRVDDMVIVEFARRFQDRWVRWVSHDDSPDVQLQTLFNPICPSGEVDDCGLSGATH